MKKMKMKNRKVKINTLLTRIHNTDTNTNFKKN